MFDLHVIGAGPAGSISAISAIRERNARVLLSEEHAASGLPVHCSGMLSIDGLESFREFVDYKKAVINSMRGAVIDFAGERLVIQAKKDVAYVCNRAELDRSLAENAEKQGAEIRYNERIARAARFASVNIIGADGPNSFVASHFGFPPIRKYVSTLQAMIRYHAPEMHSVEVFLSNTLFPGFFGWIIPHNEEEAEFGCGVELPHNAMNAFNALLKLKGMAKKNVPKPTGAIIPIKTRSKTAMRVHNKTQDTGLKTRNILLVGDAAGQAKSSTGGGVIFGGNCARLAGKYFDNPLRYELSWRKNFGFDLHAHSLVHGYLAKKDDNQLRKLGARLKTSGLETFLSKHGHMDRPSKMLNLEFLRLILRCSF